jgi:ubiquinone/menaquinone biosynthesis C-methylase UbiE
VEADTFVDINAQMERMSDMSGHEFKERDFEHPSFLFAFEDVLKGLIGGPLLYDPYFKSFGLKGDERVLDFGCGGGAGSRSLLKFLDERGHLTCIDTSSYWINKAKKRLKRYSNTECRTGDIRRMKIPDSTFDIISVFHVIHDIPPAERQGTVKALSQKLKKDGTIFVREPTRESHGMPVQEILALFSKEGLIETTHKETKSDYIGRFQKLGKSM